MIMHILIILIFKEYSGLLWTSTQRTYCTSSSSSASVWGTQRRKSVSMRGCGQAGRLPQRMLHTVRCELKSSRCCMACLGSTMTIPRGLTAAPRAQSCASSRPGRRSPTRTGPSTAAPSPGTRSASLRAARASARLPSREVRKNVFNLFEWIHSRPGERNDDCEQYSNFPECFRKCPKTCEDSFSRGDEFLSTFYYS